MRLGFLILLLTLFSIFVLAPRTSASNVRACQYQSTQARVRHDLTDSWEKTITVNCKDSFTVGSFHNNSTRFADDTLLYLTGPSNFAKYYRNGDSIKLRTEGEYYLNVSTHNQTGNACEEQAKVIIDCNAPRPTPTPNPTSTPRPNRPANANPNSVDSCVYRSTQARVQSDEDSPWEFSTTIQCGESLNVGSFHDKEDEFATDTTIEVKGPRPYYYLLGEFENGEQVQFDNPGIYKVQVTTEGSNYIRCKDEATVKVKCE